MRICRSPEDVEVTGPSLVDHFLEGALELDVDLLCDGESAWVAAILEHVEPAGSHSGDSACVIPAPSVGAEARDSDPRARRRRSPRASAARGLMNLQLAIVDGELWVIEANPRASRTVPFVAKATGVPLVEHACRLMLGESLAALGLPERAEPTRAWAKEAIFPSDRFPGADVRGPEMRSTGEVMAGGNTPAEAYARALRAAGRAVRRARSGRRFRISTRRVERWPLTALPARSPVPVLVPAVEEDVMRKLFLVALSRSTA